MRDALRSDYPALAELLGERGFAKLVADYVAVHPSRSFTLARLGDHLPEFLAGWGSPRRRGLRTDVARLERAGAQVFDAEETAPLDADALQALPAADWPKLRLRPAAAFRLVRVRPGALTSSTPSSKEIRFPRGPAAAASRWLTTGGISSFFAGRWAPSTGAFWLLLRRGRPSGLPWSARAGPSPGAFLPARSFRAGSRSGPGSGSSPGIERACRVRPPVRRRATRSSRSRRG